ncbi:uncharacterized protein KQ657_001261 [Scheffersomyces spartinae]|uniref:ATPase expression protein 2, mitochondrial n=1 Tax=Scheffersomyces spartinae TaxID=45513 RepID=A0A9P8AHH8_9ASCO|nr:uncharacterized protein KQ657_001261 [Scheffersomyces spartinae]KAG7192806.1 hypothetical protein KQ657_001261 [Scheffersomyces spartinae]
MRSVLRRGNVIVRGAATSAIPATTGIYEFREVHSEVKGSTVSKLRTRNFPSQQFDGSLSSSHLASAVSAEGRIVRDQVKLQIYECLQNNQYEVVIRLLKALTDTKTQEELGRWNDVLTKEELSFFLGKLVTYQKQLVVRATSSKAVSLDQIEPFQNANITKNNIRTIYNNLLYGSRDQTFMYDRSTRNDLTVSPDWTGYELMVHDYENLIELEITNMKFDLASKWFQRFDQQFGETSIDHMTHRLWVLKLETYCGGYPSSWEISDKVNELTTLNHQPKQSFLKLSKNFLVVFNEFLQLQKVRGGTALGKSLGSEFVKALIYSAGYSRNTEYLTKMIHLIYGIDAKGELVMTKSEDLVQPTQQVLEAIFVAYAYNNEIFSGLKYINAFQQLYNIDLSSRHARSLWGKLFRWSENMTRYDESKTLIMFMKIENTNSDKSVTIPVVSSLEEAQSNINFDYEGYVEYVESVRTKRLNTMNALWSLYKANNSFYSNSAYYSYYKILSESLKHDLKTSLAAEAVNPEVEQPVYKFLTELDQVYHTINSPESYNFGPVSLGQYHDSVRHIYESAVKDLISYKLELAHMGQVEPLIQEWSIDLQMKESLLLWYAQVKPIYMAELEDKREKKMVLLRADENDDSFLGLM